MSIHFQAELKISRSLVASRGSFPAPAIYLSLRHGNTSLLHLETPAFLLFSDLSLIFSFSYALIVFVRTLNSLHRLSLFALKCFYALGSVLNTAMD